MCSSLSIPQAGNSEMHSQGSLEGLCRIEPHLNLSLDLETNSRPVFCIGFSSLHVSPFPVSCTCHLGSLPEIICLCTNSQLSSVLLTETALVTLTWQHSKSLLNLCTPLFSTYNPNVCRGRGCVGVLQAHYRDLSNYSSTHFSVPIFRPAFVLSQLTHLALNPFLIHREMLF